MLIKLRILQNAQEAVKRNANNLMSIKQINTTYLLQEDRILLRINTVDKTEFQFLLTRRVALFILAASEHLVEKQLLAQHEPAIAKAVADFEKSNLVGMEGSGPEFEAGEAFPLGQSPILVLDVTCGIDQAEQAEQIFSIDFVLGKDKNINLKLPKPMLMALRLLLESICDQASWGRATIAVAGQNNELSPMNMPPASSGSIH